MVGSQARILYSNAEGRIAIALAFNKAVMEGKLKVLCVCMSVLNHVYMRPLAPIKSGFELDACKHTN